MADIEIVIKIPEEFYEFAKECKSKSSSKYSWTLSHDNIVLMIANGTQLPKGHGKLKDVDACKKNKKNFCEKSTRTNWYDIIDDLLDDAPTIIEAESEG